MAVQISPSWPRHSIPQPPGVLAADCSVPGLLPGTGFNGRKFPWLMLNTFPGQQAAVTVSWGSTKAQPPCLFGGIYERLTQLLSSLYDWPSPLLHLDGSSTPSTAQCCCPHSFPGCCSQILISVCFWENPIPKKGISINKHLVPLEINMKVNEELRSAIKVPWILGWQGWVGRQIYSHLLGPCVF